MQRILARLVYTPRSGRATRSGSVRQDRLLEVIKKGSGGV
jgi:hypothetical protein